MAKLTATTARALRAPGKYGDGDGLWLQVGGPNRRSWILRFAFAGKPREMGLGAFPEVSLAEAREKAAQARKLIRDGVDPVTERRAEQQALTATVGRAASFQEVTKLYLAAHQAGWRNAKHTEQWRSTLNKHAFPVLGKMVVAEIATRHVLQVLNPIWKRTPETASRVRGRIEAILSYATVQGWREGQNPAVWRGHLQLMLPARGKVQPVQHHAALDWREAPAFMKALVEREGMAPIALAFAILTGARSGDVRGATWAEIDLDNALWTIPAERMKARRQHRVPLSEWAMRLLKEVHPLRADEASVVFPGLKRIRRRHQPLSDMTLTAVLKRMGRSDLTAHGFRSTFCDWAAEATNYPNHVVELALAHAIGNKVEAAYRRGDLFEKRTALMADWAAFLTRKPATIVRLPKGQGAFSAVVG